MFQTLLFVVGPFLAYAGLGVAAIIAAQAWVRKWVMPRWSIMRSEIERYDEMADAVADSQELLTEIVLELDANPLLEGTLSPRLQHKLYELNETTRALPSQRITRNRRKNRA